MVSNENSELCKKFEETCLDVNKKVKLKKDIIFQVTDWDYYDDNANVNDDGDCSSDHNFTIRMYGTTKDTHKKIFVKVTNFQPYFYIKLPQEWTTPKIDLYINLLKKKVEQKDTDYVDSLLKHKIVKRHIFHGFTNNAKFKFIKLIFDSYDGFKAYEKALRYPIQNYMLSRKPIKADLFESNILPLLRCVHSRKLETVGWVKIEDGYYINCSDNPSYNDINIETNWSHLEPEHIDTTSPLIFAAYDIECYSESGDFPQAKKPNDRVIQIGTSFCRYGEEEPFLNSVITLKKASPVEGLEIESYENEHEVLLAWKKLIHRVNPDFITGYNIFGFDDKYMADRAKLLGCYREFSILGRLRNLECKFTSKELSSSALGSNKLEYFEMNGRVQFDLMKVIQRDHKLTSYKLDNVASEFIKEKIVDVIIKDGSSYIATGGTYGLEIGKYIKIYYNDGLSDNFYQNNAKFKVLDIIPEEHIINGKKYNLIKIGNILDGEALEFKRYTVYWAQAKDDVGPQDIFRLQKGNADDRATLARYCIQDCILCIKLINKLQIITNNISMANVCHVPLSFIFLRGQGIKIFSLVSKVCKEEGYLIPVIRKPYDKNKNKKDIQLNKVVDKNDDEEDKGYEGATVFEPNTGIHYDPVAVLDYNSLYPQSMRHRNISRETIVLNSKYDNLPGYRYVNIEYYSKKNKHICRYAIPENGKKGILPTILANLLSARSQTKKDMAKENDPFKKNVLNGKQLALKVTANSLYGQCGASTSQIYMKELAASTTATGREMLNAARIYIEVILRDLVISIKDNNKERYLEQINLLFEKKVDEMIGKQNIKELKKIKLGEDIPRYKYLDIFKDNPDPIDDSKFTDGYIDEDVVDDRILFGNKENNKIKYTNKNEFIEWFYKIMDKILEGYVINPIVMYGDTDSVFIKFQLADEKTGEILKNHFALKMSILIGIFCSKLLHKILPDPHNMVYEKTMWPFIILCKKKYVGNLYEENPNKFYQNNMGIVLKRRDNAPIVKIMVGGIVKSILNDKDTNKAIAFTKKTLSKILRGEFPAEKFVMSKTLKGPGLTTEERKLEMIKPKEDRYYSDRSSIAHAVLADRIADRDPGNKPASNDRIQYCYIVPNKKVKLQGERIDTPEYIAKNNVPIDYLFYITNQLLNPSIDFLEHIILNSKKIFEYYIKKELNKREGKYSLDYYLKNKELDKDIYDIIESSYNLELSDQKGDTLEKKKLLIKGKKTSINKKTMCDKEKNRQLPNNNNNNNNKKKLPSYPNN